MVVSDDGSFLVEDLTRNPGSHHPDPDDTTETSPRTRRKKKFISGIYVTLIRPQYDHHDYATRLTKRNNDGAQKVRI